MKPKKIEMAKAFSLSPGGKQKVQCLVSTLKEVIKTVDDLDAEIAEVGVYRGGSLLGMARSFLGENFYGFDTFKGLPKECVHDNHHKEGDFSDTSYLSVLDMFCEYPNVKLYRGLFPQETGKEIEHLSFKFCHIDTDLYQSHVDSFKFFWPKLVEGGMIFLDDYDTGTCLGVKKATDEFVKNHGLKLVTCGFGQAYFKKE